LKISAGRCYYIICLNTGQQEEIPNWVDATSCCTGPGYFDKLLGTNIVQIRKIFVQIRKIGLFILRVDTGLHNLFFLDFNASTFINSTSSKL
jgi:hypothetical protein